jgi:hypothetical protein
MSVREVDSNTRTRNCRNAERIDLTEPIDQEQAGNECHPCTEKCTSDKIGPPQWPERHFDLHCALKESWDRLMKGEVITGDDHYFILAPTMQTSAEKYAWLNHVQCIGKVVEVKLGENAFVKYDIYIVR